MKKRRPNNWNTFSVTSRKKLLSFQCRTLRLKRVTSKVQAEREKKWRARKLNSSKLAFSLSPFLLLSLSLRLKFRKGLISFFRPPTKAFFLGFKGHGSADRPLTLGLGSSLNFPEIFLIDCQNQSEGLLRSFLNLSGNCSRRATNPKSQSRPPKKRPCQVSRFGRTEISWFVLLLLLLSLFLAFREAG